MEWSSALRSAGTPLLPRNYFIEVQLISSAGVIQESFTVVLTFLSQNLLSFTFTPVPMQMNEPGMHEIGFTTPYLLPASALQTDATQLVSYIKITYLPHPINVPTNPNPTLGYGYTIPTLIPCKALIGLNPITGNSINCTLYPGTSPYVIVTNYAQVPANGQILIYLANQMNPSNWIQFDVRLVGKQNRLLNLISVAPFQQAQFTTNTTCSSPLLRLGHCSDWPGTRFLPLHQYLHLRRLHSKLYDPLPEQPGAGQPHLDGPSPVRCGFVAERHPGHLRDSVDVLQVIHSHLAATSSRPIRTGSMVVLPPA